MDPLQDLQGIDAGMWLALVKAFPNGREDVDAVLRGDKEITLKDAIRLLFDKNGRCIPTIVTSRVCDASNKHQYHRLGDKFHLAEMLKEWQNIFHQRLLLSVEDYSSCIRRLIEEIETDRRIANLLKGAWYPVLLPQIPPSDGDYGTILETEVLPAVVYSYETEFGRPFANHVRNKLLGAITIIDDRHQQLINRMKIGQVLGIACYPLQGFSVNAQREIARSMPENFSLMGAIDGAIVHAIYPRQLSFGQNSIAFNCSAIKWGTREYTLAFGADNDRLSFGGGHNTHMPREDYSGGFFIRA